MSDVSVGESAGVSRGVLLERDLVARTADVRVSVLALEAGRIADRLDELDRIIHGDGVLELIQLRTSVLDFDSEVVTVNVKFDSVLSEARQQATALAGLIEKIDKLSGAAPSAPATGPAASVLDQVRERRARRAGA